MPGDTKGKILFMIPVGAAGLMVGKQQLQTVVIQVGRPGTSARACFG